MEGNRTETFSQCALIRWEFSSGRIEIKYQHLSVMRSDQHDVVNVRIYAASKVISPSAIRTVSAEALVKAMNNRITR